MSDHYMTILMALSSAVVGGSVALISVFLTNRSNTARLKMQFEQESRQQRTDLLRGRGEELYELTDKWLKKLAGYYLRRTSVMHGKLTYNQCYDLEIKESEGESVNFGRIDMLIDVYFPSNRSAYDKIIEGRTELNKIIITHKQFYESGDIDGSRFLKPFVQCQKSIEHAGEVFKMKILELIRDI